MQYKIQGETLTAIADAIRSKIGTEIQYAPGDMPEAIDEIYSTNLPYVYVGTATMPATQYDTIKITTPFAPKIVGAMLKATVDDVSYDTYTVVYGITSDEQRGVYFQTDDYSRTYTADNTTGTGRGHVIGTDATGFTLQTCEPYFGGQQITFIALSGEDESSGENYAIVPITVDLSNEVWENRNFAHGSSNNVITCNKIVQIPQGAVSVSADITLSNGYRADSCFAFFANESQVQAYDKTDASSYTNNDYADGWQSTSESKHILPYLSGRYAFEFIIARNPVANEYTISPSDLLACTLTFYCVRQMSDLP